jgi:phage terminase large subunit
MQASPAISAQFPEKLQCLFQPMRYKILWGGRAAGRSWGVARALLLIGVQRGIRVLCARELQKSIAESCHKLLSDQIEELGLSHLYTIQQSKIYGPNGTEFSFEGIKNNVNAVKSYEGIDICWVEEANKVSKNSWEVLIPTIRKDGSEIWMTFNPELETDYTYVYFVKKAPKNAFVVHMTWEDNPWVSQAILDEKDKMKRDDFDSYLNVWMGKTRQMLEGAVFAKQLRLITERGQICAVPHDPETPVDTFWDLGKRDLTSIWFIQRVAMQYRVLNYLEARGEDVEYYLHAMQRLPYMYGAHYLPHDGKHKRLGQKRSVQQIVKASYPNNSVLIVPKINNKTNAINAARVFMPQCWFDEENCGEGLARLRNYTYEVEDGQFSDQPLHDDNSNGADAFMTAAQSFKLPRDKSGVKARLEAAAAAATRGLGRRGHIDIASNTSWMR